MRECYSCLEATHVSAISTTILMHPAGSPAISGMRGHRLRNDLSRHHWFEYSEPVPILRDKRDC
jgi:hypothetical protein